MNRTRYLTATTLALAALSAPMLGGAQAQVGPQSASNANAPIYFGGDSAEYVGDTVTLKGRAELTQGQNRLRANQVAGLSQTGGDSRIEATGDVYFVTPEQTIRGDRAIYDTANDTIVVTGDVILTQGQNVLTGSRLTYNLRTEAARIEGGSGEGGRVRGVFYPERNGT